ncbi:flagellin [Saccharospirillum impatiens]|jgi:flagellin|uniref:flagellin n=1 Tax=Saccharospirillum impatiens TaxID=169438 RepID=UPI00041E24B3|nr:flagellin [Saccharospirillum impatiens]
MALSINSPAYTPTTDNRFNTLARQGSSGLRINSAADDAAGTAIAQGFSSQVRGIDVAARNIGDGISLLQTRSGAMGTMTEQLQRMRELTVQANNGINGPEERNLLNQEFTTLRDTLFEQIDQAQFNNRPLFGSDQQVFQTGPDAGQTTVVEGNALNEQLDQFGLGSLSLTSNGDLGNVLNSLDDAISAVSSAQASDGALANRLEAQGNTLMQQRLDTSATLSRIQDLDYAKFASELAQTNVRDQVKILMQGQANANRETVLRLLTD